MDARFPNEVLVAANARDPRVMDVHRVDLATGAAEVLTGHIPWDIQSFDRSDDGRYLAYVANADVCARGRYCGTPRVDNRAG